MSTVRYFRNGVEILTYAGPTQDRSPHSNSRTRVQITTDESHIRLSMDQWIDLVCFIREMDARCEGITSVPEVEGR